MQYAPIVLFTYNRPIHTHKIIEFLKQNSIAHQSDLFIYSDGPKTNQDNDNVSAVRTFINSITGFKSLKIFESPHNKGLAKSIIDGVSEIVNQYGRIIVLEDDIEVSPYFLDYMNTALDMYEKDERIMHVNGWRPPFSSIPETALFSSVMECWGWSTWKESWRFFKRDPEYFINMLSKNQRFTLNINNSYDSFNDILRNQSGEINTWAVFWHASIIDKQGLCLSPSVSLTNNIGTDGTGNNFSFSTSKYNTYLSEKPITSFPKKIENSEDLFLAYSHFYKSHKLSMWGHIKLKTKKLFNLLARFF
jgi:hypothetical protein